MPLADKAGAPEGNQNAVKIETGDKNNGSVTTIDLKPKQDRGKTYLLRRLARDFPQALDRIQSGELSTRKAAIEYGIVKVKTPMRISETFWNFFIETYLRKEVPTKLWSPLVQKSVCGNLATSWNWKHKPRFRNGCRKLDIRPAQNCAG